MNLDDFSTVIEDRRYINPQVGLDESNAFIENLRNTQQANTQEIAQDTYNLGTAVPSNLGGLGGAGTYFTSRYQTPQTNDVVANLRSAAQAQALNEALNNRLAQAKEKYNQAYRRAQKRAGSTGPATNPSDIGKQISRLPIKTNSGVSGSGFVDPAGTDPTTHNGKTLRSVDKAEYAQNQLIFETLKPKSGHTINRNGRTYMYISDGSRPTGWYAVVGE